MIQPAEARVSTCCPSRTVQTSAVDTTRSTLRSLTRFSDVSAVFPPRSLHLVLGLSNQCISRARGDPATRSSSAQARLEQRKEETRASQAASLRARLDDPSRQIDQRSRAGAELVWRGVGLDAVKMVRELDTKRRIIFFASQMPELLPTTADFDGQRGAWTSVLGALAAVYGDHPDYD